MDQLSLSDTTHALRPVLQMYTVYCESARYESESHIYHWTLELVPKICGDDSRRFWRT
jgi:hypothetical protein